MSRLVAALVNGHRRHPAQFLLLLAGLALAVATVVAIDLTLAGARVAFAHSQRLLTGAASHQLRAEGGTLEQRLLAVLKQVHDVRRAAPVVEGSARPAAGGERLRVLGVDPVAEAEFRTWLAAALDAGMAASRGPTLASLLGDERAVAIGEPLARRLGVAAGDPLPLRARGRVQVMRVAATIPAGRLPSGADDLLLLDIPAAQRLLDLSGRLSRIDLRLDDTEAVRLAAALPAGVSLARTAERTAALAGISHAFETNLRALGLLALLVGVFLVFQILSFLGLRRRGLIGLWRALGVSRVELTRVLLGEAATLGALAGVAGIGAGTVLADLLLEPVVRTYNDLYYPLRGAAVTLSPAVLGKGLALALGGALLAAAWPLRDALAVPPLANLRRLPAAASAARRIRRSLWPALALLAFGALALRVGPQGLGFAFAAIFLMLVAALALIPWLALHGLGFAERRLRGRAPALGALLLGSLRLGLDRTGIALAVLTLAVATLIGMGTMIHSFRLAVEDWVNRSLRAELYLSGEDGAPLPPELVAGLSGLPGVEGLSLSQRRGLDARHGPLTVLGLRLPAAGFQGYELLAGDPQQARERFLAGEALVSEPLANRLHLRVGDHIGLPTPNGEVTLPIAGIYRDYSSAQGVVAVALDRYRALWRDPAVGTVGVYAAPEDVPAIAAAIGERLAAYEDLTLTRAADIRARTLEVFARTFAVTDLLRALAALIAVVAVLGALLALQLERQREHALLRALGLAAGGMARLQLAQAGLIGALAALLAAPMGVAMAWLLIEVINRRAFGWSMALALPPAQILGAMALALGSALLAGWLPARRAAGLNLARLLRETPL